MSKQETGNGKGSSKYRSPEQDAAARKAAQHRKSARKGAGKGLHNETLTEGLRQERQELMRRQIFAEGEFMLDMGLRMMVSSSKQTQKVLMNTLVAFVDTYVSVDNMTLRDAGQYRDQYAIEHAVKDLKGERLTVFAKRTLGYISREMRQQRKAATEPQNPESDRRLVLSTTSAA